MTPTTLPDGRLLDLDVSGPDGAPVLVFHHGTPGCGLPPAALGRVAQSRGLRLVTWSRPGYAGSTRQPGRRVAEVAADFEAVLDVLGADRAWVAGWSGGGPHALACATLARERVLGALVIAGVAPRDAAGLDWLAGMGEDNQEEFSAALAGEAVLRQYLDGAREELGEVTGAEVVEALGSLVSPVDRDALAARGGEFADDLARSLRTSLSSGVDGWLDDDLAFLRSWGFDPAEATVPIHLWQGSEDLMVPFAHGSWLAARLPRAIARLEQGEGHLSLVAERLDPMLAGLLDA